MKPKIIVALDTSDPRFVRELIQNIPAPVFKVGLEIIYSPMLVSICDEIYKKDAQLFFDAKLFDIPTTVAKATENILYHFRPDFLTVRENTNAVIEAAKGSGTMIVSVPYLTSEYPRFTHIKTPALVCPPMTAITYRELYPDLTIICPGVRLPGEERNDHIGNTVIPKDADYIVVGRPITQADDPSSAYFKYENEIDRLSRQ